ncbi:sensor histidine kinase CssS [Lachnospiraceae bacterium]|nr:HAMP domain-containing sensor histidine kinase [Acetatifactor sp.]GFI64465.1 sensor histidine kinase CssS [Lachnospiraceae bacterium]
MESLKNRWHNLPLRRFFMLTVLFTAGAVALLSGLVIWGCVLLRQYLLPEADAVWLTVERQWDDGTLSQEGYRIKYGEQMQVSQVLIMEDGVIVEREGEEFRYAVQRIENSVDLLSPRRKAVYQLCGVVMAAAPAAFAFAGIFLCSVYFYRRKLRAPLLLLSGAAGNIAGQNLDFVLEYECKDELGALCSTFENMRRALYENNKAMWRMLEERKLLQASVAHDLRNPIAIIGGYTEYLKNGLTAGEMGREKILHIAENLEMASKRLARYTESVGVLNQSEEAAMEKERLPASCLPGQLTEDIRMLAEQRGIAVRVTGELPEEEITADGSLLHRVLENVAGNALRYAKREIWFDFSLSEGFLMVTVSDDGEGFPEEVLRKKDNFFVTPGEDGHMGIGLAVSRLLCGKHGGGLTLENTPEGARVTVRIAVEREERKP